VWIGCQKSVGWMHHTTLSARSHFEVQYPALNVKSKRNWNTLLNNRRTNTSELSSLLKTMSWIQYTGPQLSTPSSLMEEEIIKGPKYAIFQRQPQCLTEGKLGQGKRHLCPWPGRCAGSHSSRSLFLVTWIQMFFRIAMLWGFQKQS
jgi:hypothetical protein